MEIGTIKQLFRWNMVTSLPLMLGGCVGALTGVVYLAMPRAEKAYRGAVYEQTAYNYRRVARVAAASEADLASASVAGALNASLPRPLRLEAADLPPSAATAAVRRRRIVAYNAAVASALWPAWKSETQREKYLLERMEESTKLAFDGLQAAAEVRQGSRKFAAELLHASKGQKVDGAAKKD
eukprot:CAMPEP_0205820176 /NCGR_PEP_ID=MMETSP0206-20130828/2782_1 /ASSEMBLY_ACC=CAM_ASM_000279 /TAXON_ID=36767 /ORGANISM="Euplotes focardii, Strain TN1" /LENGTH=181 /DNA_ID=CAMNT_0053114625 /DNA_START=12 /DNA_END=554 /DNA_ORIENTATION=-